MNTKLSEVYYELFFVLFYTWSYIVGSVLGITRHFLDVGILDIGFMYLLLLLLFLKVCRVFFSRLSFKVIGWSVAFVIVLLAATIVSINVETNFTVIKRVLIYCLPLLVFGSCVRNYEIVYRYLVYIMILFVALSVLSYIMFGLGLDDDKYYSQQQAYKMLLPAVVLLSDTFSRFTLKCFIPFLVSLFLIVAYGARGPLIAVAAFTVLYLLFSPKGQWTRNSKLSLLIISLIVIFAVFRFGSSFYLLSDTLSSMNFSSRTLDMIGDGSLLEDEERERLAEISLQGINEHPIFGVGPINDRNYISLYYNSGKANTGNYPHNVFLELMLQYGILLGGLFALLFLRMAFIKYRDKEDPYKSKLLLILFSVSFIPLLYSGSYLQQEHLYLFIAFCISSGQPGFNKLSHGD